MDTAENLQVTEFRPENRPHADNASTILFIDNGHRDRRRERNAALKNAGYKVHPARSFEQSISRVGSGSYDLIIANTEAAWEPALRFIQDVKRDYPQQRLLVLKNSDAELPGDFDLATTDSKLLVERVDALMKPADRPRTEPVAA